MANAANSSPALPGSVVTVRPYEPDRSTRRFGSNASRRGRVSPRNRGSRSDASSKGPRIGITAKSALPAALASSTARRCRLPSVWTACSTSEPTPTRRPSPGNSEDASVDRDAKPGATSTSDARSTTTTSSDAKSTRRKHSRRPRRELGVGDVVERSGDRRAAIANRVDESNDVAAARARRIPARADRQRQGRPTRPATASGHSAPSAAMQYSRRRPRSNSSRPASAADAWMRSSSRFTASTSVGSPCDSTTVVPSRSVT